ncbi:MAG: glycosyltransferase, partial [Desulfobulbaceae bacterium]|nr:glycosyltransferase [Desulfobulbaceae bacterium]
TYDTGKPRNRIILEGLHKSGVEITRCQADIWSGVEDKSQVRAIGSKIIFLTRWLLSYPSLIFRYLTLPRHDVVFVGYLGQLDVLVLWPFAKLRKNPIAWDAFISLYDTVVCDRKMVSPRHPLAFLLYWWEWLACRAADLVILDTRSHADFFVDKFHIPREKTTAVPVGAEENRFYPRVGPDGTNKRHETTVLFYGQFIPLHGIATIIEAARLMRNDEVRWIIIGSGQEEEKIRAMLREDPLSKMEWLPWVPYEQLIDRIAEADICLGIFGDSEKASRVIPNKVYQILAVGKPLITRDSPAARELLSPSDPGIILVHPADPSDLAAAVRRLAAKLSHQAVGPLHRELCKRVSVEAIGKKLQNILSTLIKSS